MTLESSEQEFTTRFAAFAARGTLYPQVEGSPLLEFAAGGRVLYLFDRTGPYSARPGPASVVVHGVLEPGAGEQTDAGGEEVLTVHGVSSVEGRGRLLSASRRHWVVQARLPLVLSSFDPLPVVEPGAWVSFRTLPPLHGFLVELPGTGAR